MRTQPVQLQIEQRTSEDGIVIVTLTGRLILGPEVAGLETLVKNLLQEGVRRFVFDFSGLTHIDSTGIGLCISSLNLIMQAGGKLHIGGAAGAVRDAFRITQLDRVFRFFEDVPSAVSALGTSE